MMVHAITKLRRTVVLAMAMTVALVVGAGWPSGLLAVTLPEPPQRAEFMDLSLGLEDAILLSMRRNPAVLNARLDQVVQQFALQVARYKFQPQWSLKASTERQYALSELASTDSHVMPSVSYLSPIGTQWQLDVSRDFVSPVTDRSYQSTTATASVMQPLLKGAGAVAGFSLVDAQQQALLQQRQFRHNIMAEVTHVIKAYHQLVRAHHGVTINQMALQESQRELDNLKLKQTLGKASDADLLTQEAQIASQRLALESSRNGLDEQRRALLTLLGMAPDVPVVPVFAIDLSNIPAVLPSQAQVVERVLQYDMAYQAALANQDQAKRGFQTAQQDRKWQLDLHASASVVRPRNRGPETHSHSGDKRVGLDLRIPINDMHTKQAYVEAEVGVERAAMAVRAAKQAAESKALGLWRHLLAAKAEVSMAEKAADLTQQTLANAKLKLQYGRASAFEVTTLRDGLTSKQLAVVGAKIDYADAYAALSEGMGQTLGDWHISLQEGVS